MKKELPLCECGCGKPVTKEGNRFITGHNTKGIPKSPEHCAAISDAHTGVPLSPEHCAAISVGLKGVPKSPAHCAAISKAKKGIPNSPEHCTAISDAHKGVPFSQEHKSAISKAKLGISIASKGVLHTSEAQIASDEGKRGGYDIIQHHYLYNHSDLSLNTVQMTRSDHMSLHRLLQKLGYIVPHINIKEE